MHDQRFLVTPMTGLILGLAVFFGLHLIRELGLRSRFVDQLGSENSYKGLFSLLALLGLGLIIWGKSAAPFIMLWEPRFELRSISHMIMIPASILIVAGNVPRSYIQYFVKNPMLAGVALWGIAHLWSNGDLASALLFGGFVLWAGFKFYTLGLESEKKQQQRRPYFVRDIIAIVGGLIMYLLISRYHGQLFGVGLDFV